MESRCADVVVSRVNFAKLYSICEWSENVLSRLFDSQFILFNCYLRSPSNAKFVDKTFSDEYHVHMHRVTSSKIEVAPLLKEPMQCECQFGGRVSSPRGCR